MTAIFAILFSLGIFFFNYTINKSIFYPPALFSLVWSIVLIAYGIIILTESSYVFLVQDESLLIFVLGEIFFTVGGLFAVNRKLAKPEIQHNVKFNYSFDKLVFFFLLIMLPLYIKRLLEIANSSEISDANFFIVLRYEFVVNDVDIGILKYLNAIALFGFPLVLYKYHFQAHSSLKLSEKIYKYLFYLLVITYAVLSTGRTYLLLMFCIYIGFKAITGTLKRRHYITAGVGFFIIFGTIAIILRKAGGEDMGVIETMGSVFKSFSDYFLGGIYAFNSIIKSGFTLDHGENSFRFFIALFHTLGLSDKEPVDLVMPFVYTPIASNVYSVYYVYIKDFWYFGLLFMSLWSYIHTWLYYRAKHNFLYMYVYALLLYPLITSFFQDQYISLLSTWIQYVAFGYMAMHFIIDKRTVNSIEYKPISKAVVSE
ncbi:MAG TPA: O-antigen polymerase [Panacibacter sp.]|nr:O-antigen polymerase [Panacibacter sp.]